MFISKEQTGGFGSFKLGYSRGLPSYLAPKLFVHKKQEEFFVANLFAQNLTYLQVPVIGVYTTDDDSNKGADAVIKIADGREVSIQVTRFTLTDYLNRRKVAEKKVEKLITRMKEKVTIDFPVNITIDTYQYKTIPANNEKMEIRLGHYLASLLEANMEKLRNSNEFVNCEITIERLKPIIPLITFQRVPEGFHSNFFGRDNIFINYEFDNIHFTKEDIDKEALNIFTKKNGGKASTLLIWADTWDILYDPKPFAECLQKHFVASTFKQVIFFDFYNRIDMYYENKIRVAEIKVQKEIIYE